MDTHGIDHRGQARSGLAAAAAGGSPADLVRGALLIAAEEYPRLDVDRERRRVERMAVETGCRADAAGDNPFARLDALRSYLFEELRFSGNREDFDDPRNSYLNDVLERRIGIPLTLSMLVLAVAERAGFEGRGVALPGHFICSLERHGRRLLIDPYHGGHLVTEEDCLRLVSRSTGRTSLFRREQLDGTDIQSMLARMLLNLKHVYLSAGDYERALAAVERLLLLRQDDANEIRDRGFLKAHLGRPAAAIRDLQTYLELAPVAPDAESVKGRLDWLRRRMAR